MRGVDLLINVRDAGIAALPMESSAKSLLVLTGEGGRAICPVLALLPFLLFLLLVGAGLVVGCETTMSMLPCSPSAVSVRTSRRRRPEASTPASSS